MTVTKADEHKRTLNELKQARKELDGERRARSKVGEDMAQIAKRMRFDMADGSRVSLTSFLENASIQELLDFVQGRRIDEHESYMSAALRLLKTAYSDE